MGYIKERMTKVFSQRPLRPYDFSSDDEVLPYVIVMDCRATDAKSFTYKLKFPVRVVDAWIIPTADSASGTAQVQDHDGNAITDAMACATDQTIARAATIDDDNWDEDKGNNLKVVQHDNGDSCWAFIVVIPRK